MNDCAVVIAGGGPTGLMLAAELALAGVDVSIVEPRRGHELEGSRSRGLHARTIEVLDQRGVADRFLAEGQAMQVQSFGMIRLDISDFPTRHHYGLALGQEHFERILGGWVDELGVRFHRGCSVTGFTQDESGVEVHLDDGRALGAEYLVGCDGGRSLVRRSAGIEFAGFDPSVSSLIAEVSMRAEPAWGIRRDQRGQHALGKLDGGARVGVVVSEPYTGQSGEPTLDELRRALVSVWGTDFGVHSPTWLSRFTDATRQAVTYRVNRVLLAGDAAHVHYPVGGQGLNLGVQDAVNLGWKLAQVVMGRSPDSLLDSYQAERHPVAARVLRTTMAASALLREDDRIGALRDTLTELLRMEEPRKSVAGIISGLDIRYDLGDGHPLVGRRMPHLDLDTGNGPMRVFALLHDARPLLLNLGGSGGFDMAPWA
ncbi:MAG TPA: FAD-dependent monooxygenase, partial [Acidimicrobiales bacterium]|nr:FAD-dependent monooxygenase [Acidimicrobiales bacterium]